MAGFKLCRNPEADLSEVMESSGSSVSDFHEHGKKELEDISISSDITDTTEQMSERLHNSHYRKRLYAFMETTRFRVFVIILIVLDVLAVSLELAIASDAFGEVETEAPCPPAGQPRAPPSHNHDLENGEKFLHWFSISLLCIFVLENIAMMWCIGLRKFFSSFVHVFDFCVVAVSLVLELWLGHDNAYAGLLVLLRLIRIVQGVVAAEQEAHVDTQSRLKRSLNHNKHLRRLFKNFLLEINDVKLDAQQLYLAKHLLHNSKRFERKQAKYLAEIEASVPSKFSFTEDSETINEDRRLFAEVNRDHKRRVRKRESSRNASKGEGESKGGKKPSRAGKKWTHQTTDEGSVSFSYSSTSSSSGSVRYLEDNSSRSASSGSGRTLSATATATSKASFASSSSST